MHLPGVTALALSCLVIAACRCEGPAEPASSSPPAAPPAEARSLGGVLLPKDLPETLRRALVSPTDDHGATGRALADLSPVPAELLEALAKSPSLDDVLVALRAWGHLGPDHPLPDDALGPLVEHSADAVSELAMALATSRGELGPVLDLIPRAAGATPLRRLRAVQALAGWSSPAIDALLLRCAGDDDADLAEACAALLGDPGRQADLEAWLREEPLTIPKAIVLEARAESIDDALRTRLAGRVDPTAERPPELAIRAARLLYFATPAEGLDALSSRLAGAVSPDLRRIVAEFSEDTELLTRLTGDPAPAVRAAAIAGLGRSHREAMRGAALGAALRSEDPVSRAAAIATISATVPLTEATRMLSARLAEVEAAEQAQVAAGLRAIPDRQAIDALIDSLGDPKAGRAAFLALSYLAGEQPTPGVDPVDFFRQWRDRRFATPTR